MDETEIVSLIPKLFLMKDAKSKYEIVIELNMCLGGKSYKKVEELISYGFLEKIEVNPPKFEVTERCRDRIWKFFNNTPIGDDIMRMVEARKIIIG